MLILQRFPGIGEGLQCHIVSWDLSVASHAASFSCLNDGRVTYLHRDCAMCRMSARIRKQLALMGMEDQSSEINRKGLARVELRSKIAKPPCNLKHKSRTELEASIMNIRNQNQEVMSHILEL